MKRILLAVVLTISAMLGSHVASVDSTPIAQASAPCANGVVWVWQPEYVTYVRNWNGYYIPVWHDGFWYQDCKVIRA